MIIRFPFKLPRERPAFMGNELEDGAVIDLDAKEVRGYFGAYISLPEDPTQPAERHTSEPFVVKLTDGDVANIKAVVEAQIAATGAKGKMRYGMTLNGATPVVRCDPDPFDVTLTLPQIDAIANIVFLRAIEQGVADLDPTSQVIKVI